MSYFGSMEENKSTVRMIQPDNSQATSNIFTGSSSPGPSNKPAGEELTSKRTTMKLGSGSLKRSKE
jgi:hypothetical protein